VFDYNAAADTFTPGRRQLSHLANAKRAILVLLADPSKTARRSKAIKQRKRS
jgi:hypothetical protein